MSPRELTRAKKFWHGIFGAVKMVRCSVNKVCRALFWHRCQFHPSRAKNFLWCKPGLKWLTDSTRHKSLLRQPAYSNPVVTCWGERCSRLRVQTSLRKQTFLLAHRRWGTFREDRETVPLAKRPQLWAATRNGCFRCLEFNSNKEVSWSRWLPVEFLRALEKTTRDG